ncbi:YncE family protein [Ancylobacter vacuolatus]|uniref:YVTN family beta-propeller protein n=1 Tax=Ancylobacter vacuolatus TaxID=223389 RepID=A0ABU0DDA2_9HYPH|nr:YncE family protein [Ancylobacter vacuolatus]MDQ0346398.1 YVTN family beta-propeller protein [Ancylobacter vacuolatus]
MPIDATFARPCLRSLARVALARVALASVALVGLAGAALADPEFVKTVKPGAGLYELVFSAPMNRVYVAAAGARGATETFIYALDPATLETKETIALGDDPVFGLAIDNKTKTLYGTQTRDGSVAVVDLATGKVVAKLAKGEKAHVREVAVDEAANRAYVSVTGRRDTPSSVWIVDGAKKEIVGSIDNLPGSVTGIALDAKGQRLFLSAMESNEVHVVDLASKKVTSFPSGGEGAINLAYDASGDQVFVAHQGSGEVVALDAKDGKVIKKIPTGPGALSLAIDPQRNLLYVTNRQAGFTSLIDTKTLDPVANIVTGSMPQTVTVDVATGNAYVSNKLKTAGRPRPAAPPAGAAAPAGEAPRARPVPMVDPYGDTVTLIRP